jgi:hypothetical protein
LRAKRTLEALPTICIIVKIGTAFATPTAPVRIGSSKIAPPNPTVPERAAAIKVAIGRKILCISVSSYQAGENARDFSPPSISTLNSEELVKRAGKLHNELLH